MIKDFKSESERIQSQTIDLLRFPLAVMVVFIHMNPKVINLPAADFDLWSWHGVYNVFGIVFSHVFSAIAVPTFFFISGFLFFINMQKWDWIAFQKKIRNRIKTLFIPYALWNLVPFLLNLAFCLLLVLKDSGEMSAVSGMIKKASWHIFYDYHVWGTERTNWLGEHLRMTGPYDLPLWFLRDLIVVTLSTPVIYYALKRLKLGFIGILFLAYISKIWPLIPGFNITAWFFFSTGAYFAMNRINIVEWAKKYSPIALPLGIILLVITTVFDGQQTKTGGLVLPFYICMGVISIVYLASVCISKYKMRPNKFLVSSCFFIYALHGVNLPYIGVPIHFTTQCVSNILAKINGGGICLTHN